MTAADARGADTDAAAARIAAGYETAAASVTIGSVVLAGTSHPTAQVRIPLATFNRHGLVAGATGTGKTKSLQLIAEQLSAAGVPVVMPDVKGDLSGLLLPGESTDKVAERARETGDDWRPTGFPVQFFTLAGAPDTTERPASSAQRATPIRATIDSFGPILLAKVLGLNETQESTLGLIVHWADERGLPLLDLKDLRAVIAHLTSDEGKADLRGLGGVSKATAGVILRKVTNLDAQGGDAFFGEPQLDVRDLLSTDGAGRGVITLVDVAELHTQPALFSTFLMWLLAELFEELPEVGDLDKPKLVFCFDEAHLLFADASKAFLQAISQTVKLIRSKGVGVFFCTQLPTDVPGPVLSQLGARIQHALRAFTPDDQAALKATVKTYPVTEDYRLAEALTGLGTGEAIVTVLSERGAPTPVAWTRVRAPRSAMAPAPADAVAASVQSSALHAKYVSAVDRESAYERLTSRVAHGAQTHADRPTPGTAAAAPGVAPAGTPQAPEGWAVGPDGWPTIAPGGAPAPWGRPEDRVPPEGDAGGVEASPPGPPGGMLGDLLSSPAMSSFLKSLGSAVGGALGRSVTGTRRRRRR